MTTPGANPRRFRFGEFCLDLNRRSLFRADREVPLRRRSFQVLRHLIAHQGRLVTRDELMNAVWTDRVVTQDALTQCIGDIRRALGDSDQQIIRTVPRQGYLFDMPVTTGADADEETQTKPATPGSVVDPELAAASRRSRRGWSVLLGTFVIAVIFLLFRAYRPAAEDPPLANYPAAEKGIAVLPFEDMSGAEDRQYFADGLAEDILNLLAQSRELKVIARTSSFSLRGRDDLDAPAIGRLLGVTHLLEGSVRYREDTIRVTAQLIETLEGTQIWSSSYDSPVGDTLVLQSDIARAVAAAMRIALGGQEGKEGPQNLNPSAYDAFVRARYLHSRRGSGDLRRAKELYLQAIEITPDYAPPWAGLAGLYSLDLSDDSKNYDAVLAQMGRAARRAVTLDPGLAEAHVRLSGFHGLSGSKNLAKQHLALAAQLNPNSVLVLGRQASRAAMAGRIAEALDLQRRTVTVDPLSILNRRNLVGFLLAAGDCDDAMAELEKLQTLESAVPDVKQLEFQTSLCLGRLEKAASVLHELHPGPREWQSRALLYGATGDTAKAEAAMRELAEDETSRAAFLLCEIHAWRGDPGTALDWLEISFRRLGKSPTAIALFDWYAETAFSPFLKDLRAEPRARAYFPEDF